jgi:hypothetical protein
MINKFQQLKKNLKLTSVILWLMQLCNIIWAEQWVKKATTNFSSRRCILSPFMRKHIFYEIDDCFFEDRFKAINSRFCRRLLAFNHIFNSPFG